MTLPLPFNRLVQSALLAFLCLALFLPGQQSLPPFDRDEARYAVATRQMVTSGDYIDIRFQDEARHKKPIGIYWLQSLSVKAAGMTEQIWAYRAVSWMAMVFAVVLTALLGQLLFNPTVGFIAGLLLATSLLVNVEARMAKTDAALLLAILVAQFILARLYLRQTLTRLEAALFWLALGAGSLIKGPIIWLVCSGTIIMLSCWLRSIRWLQPLRLRQGLLIFLLMVLPWVIAITLKHGAAFWQESVANDLLGKTKTIQEGHGGPPGYYLGTLLITFWPWAPLLISGLFLAWRERKTPAIRFISAWAVPFWLLFELFPTKLLHYTLPIFPTLAILMAASLQAGVSRYVWLSVAVLVAALALTLPFAGGFMGAGWWPSLPSLLAAMLLLGGAYFAWRWRQPAILLAGLVAFYGITFGWALPRLDTMWVSREVANIMKPQRDLCAGPVLVSGYNEPSLVFLLGSDIQMAAPTALLPGSPCALIISPQNATIPANYRPIPLATVSGFNYARGRPVTLSLMRLDHVPLER